MIARSTGRLSLRLGVAVGGLLTALLVVPSPSAAAASPPGAAERPRSGPAAGPDRRVHRDTVEVKIGIPQQTLDALREAPRRTSAGRPADPGRRPQSDDRPGRPRSSPPAGRLSVTRAESLARKAAADQVRLTEPASSGAAAAAEASSGAGDRLAPPVGDQPPTDLVDRCFASGAEQGIGRVFNRFTYCRRIDLVATYYEIDAQGNPVEEEGTTTAKLEVFGQGDQTQRRVRLFSRIQEDSVDYDWGPIDNIFVAPNVPLSLIGQCVQGPEVCAATRGAATFPWVVWDNSSDWFYWDVFNREEIGEGRDLISYNQWFVEAFTRDNEYQTLVPGRTPSRLARCDSARYFKRGSAQFPQACVFSEVTPHLTYRLDSNVRSVAFHIFTAQEFPNRTYPLLVPDGVPPPRDKRIPGKYLPGDPDAPGLHRITKELHPGETLANRNNKNGACFKTGPARDDYLDTGLPVRPQPPAEQCDEYPFASTLEGAGHPFWDFSVRAVPQGDNSAAGGQLSSYYVNDRVLAWDPTLDRPDQTNDRFYVNIE
jgi:hypothetical protein